MFLSVIVEPFLTKKSKTVSFDSWIIMNYYKLKHGSKTLQNIHKILITFSEYP